MNKLLSGQQISTFQQSLEKNRHFVLCAHTSPDGDAVGSTLAMWHYLKGLGKEAWVILPNQFPENLSWIPGADQIILFDQNMPLATRILHDADVICCMDLNEFSRMDDVMAKTVSETTGEKWMIDHHLNPSGFATISVSFPELSSTCELVFRVIDELGGFDELTFEAAQAIYAGMCTDTGGFTYNSTRPEVFHIIAKLLEKGIDKDKIYRLIYNNNSFNRIRLQGYVLHEKLNYFEDYRACLHTITREEQQRFQFQKGDAEGLVNIPLSIKGVRLSCAMREDMEQEKILISLRSVDDFPCNKMAEMFFNGGGHLNAAGGRLTCSLDEAVELYKQALIHFKPLLLGEK